MLKTKPRLNQTEWVKRFAKAKHGHTLWDGNAEDPHNPVHAYNSSHHFVKWAQELGCFKPGDRILDLGCGNGRLEIAFAEYDVEIIGLDPVRECIEFCKEAFKDQPKMQFEFIDVWNEVFNPQGSLRPEELILEYPNEHFDFTICYSVFTHLQTVPIATRYVNEVKRTLKKGGRLFSTWYRSPPEESPNPYVGRTVYTEWDIMSMLSGFSFQFTYGGHTGEFYDQWGIFATKL